MELLNSEHIYLDNEVKHWNSVKCYLFLYKFRDGNEYNRVLARTSDYRIPKSVFGYSEFFFFNENNDKIFRTINN